MTARPITQLFCWSLKYSRALKLLRKSQNIHERHIASALISRGFLFKSLVERLSTILFALSPSFSLRYRLLNFKECRDTKSKLQEKCDGLKQPFLRASVFSMEVFGSRTIWKWPTRWRLYLTIGQRMTTRKTWTLKISLFHGIPYTLIYLLQHQPPITFPQSEFPPFKSSTYRLPCKASTITRWDCRS